MKPETTQEVIKKLEELRDSLQQTNNTFATNKCVEILELINVKENESVFNLEPVFSASEQLIGDKIAYFNYHEEDVHEIATAHKRLIEMDDGSTEVVLEETLSNINPENFHIVEILKQNPK